MMLVLYLITRSISGLPSPGLSLPESTVITIDHS